MYIYIYLKKYFFFILGETGFKMLVSLVFDCFENKQNPNPSRHFETEK